MPERSAQYENLVDSLYDLTLRPESFESFTEAWDDYLRDKQSNDPGGSTDIPEQLALHFDRALQIIEKIGREQTLNSNSIEQLVHERESPAMVLSKQGDVLSINEKARSILQASHNTKAAHELLHPDSANQLANALDKLQEANAPTPILVLLPSHSPALLLLQKVKDNDSIIVDIAGSSLDNRALETLKSIYRLTERECQIATLLYQGLSLNEIAISENRALETVRKHTKSLLKKTNTHSQSQLMRLLTSLNFAQDTEQQPVWLNSHCANYKLKLEDGRHLAYYDTGKKATKVIVVLHGILHDPELPEQMHQTLLDEGYRIIGVSRAWFGESSPPKNRKNLITSSAHDLDALLNHLGLNQVTLLATMAGSIHAMVSAALFPDRIKSIIHIAAMVPFTNETQVRKMPAGARSLFRTAKYFPNLLPLLMRTAISAIDTGDVRRLFDMAYRNSPIDDAATQRPEVFKRLKRGYTFAAHHGHGGYTYEAIAVVQNHSESIKKMKCFNYFIHGAHDGINAVDSVKDFCKTRPKTDFKIIDDAGHLVMYATPKTATEELVLALKKLSA